MLDITQPGGMYICEESEGEKGVQLMICKHESQYSTY